MHQVDWEESITASRVCVQQHIDEELDNRKYIYAGLDTVLVRPSHFIPKVSTVLRDVVVQGRTTGRLHGTRRH